MKFVETSIGELAHPDTGSFKIGPFGSSLKKEELVSEGIPVVGIENVLSNDFSSSVYRFITEKKFKQLSQYSIKVGDVLVTTMGTIGKAAVVPSNLGKVIIDSHLFRMRVDQSKINPYYLCYAINDYDGLKRQLQRKSRGSIMEGLNTSILKECSIPLPLISEQKRITAILKKAGRLCRLHRYALGLSNTYLQSVFLEMFGDPVTNPMGLDERLLDSIVTRDKFAIVDGPFGSDLKAEEYTNHGVRVIRVNNLKPNEFNFDDVRYVSLTKYQSIKRSTVLPGDVIMAKVGNTIGKTCVFPDSIQYAVLTANVCKISLNLNIALPFFICYQMNLKGLQQRIRDLSGDTAKPMINIPRLRELKLIIPELSEQKKFVNIVLSHRRMQSQQREAGRQAEHLFQTLLHKAFKGELS